MSPAIFMCGRDICDVSSNFQSCLALAFHHQLHNIPEQDIKILRVFFILVELLYTIVFLICIIKEGLPTDHNTLEIPVFDSTYSCLLAVKRVQPLTWCSLFPKVNLFQIFELSIFRETTPTPRIVLPLTPDQFFIQRRQVQCQCINIFSTYRNSKKTYGDYF